MSNRCELAVYTVGYLNSLEQGPKLVAYAVALGHYRKLVEFGDFIILPDPLPLLEEKLGNRLIPEALLLHPGAAGFISTVESLRRCKQLGMG